MVAALGPTYYQWQTIVIAQDQAITGFAGFPALVSHTLATPFTGRMCAIELGSGQIQ